MEEYNKIIESLKIRFVKTRKIDILEPVTIENSYEIENILLLVTGGRIAFGGKNKKVAEDGELIFFPGGKSIPISYGDEPKEMLSKDDFLNVKDTYLKAYTKHPTSHEHYTYVAFHVKAFDSVNFFSSVEIPPFIIEDEPELVSLLKQINSEHKSNRVGSTRMVTTLTEQLTIMLIRYVVNNGLFIEKLATNSSYFMDARLISIFNFIKENLKNDLSNKVLADVANVSEDYVGQYFKMMTGINPQDYIEYQRMEEAVNLLRTSKSSIKEIGKSVGYKDTAYFCRRFKMTFGIPAGKMKRRESLMNI